VSCLNLAVLAALADEPAESRRELERARLCCADWYGRLPEGSFDRSIARVRMLNTEEWVIYWLRDWPEMARVARDCLAEIETGLGQQPANGELLLRRAVANAFLGIAAQREGRSAEAIALLQRPIEIMRAAPGGTRVYELPISSDMPNLLRSRLWCSTATSPRPGRRLNGFRLGSESSVLRRGPNKKTEPGC